MQSIDTQKRDGIFTWLTVEERSNLIDSICEQFTPQTDELQIPLIYQMISRVSLVEFGYSFNWLPNEGLLYKDTMKLDFKGARAMVIASGIGRVAIDLLAISEKLEVVANDICPKQLKLLEQTMQQFEPNCSRFTIDTGDAVKVFNHHPRTMNLIHAGNLIHFFDEKKCRNLFLN